MTEDVKMNFFKKLALSVKDLDKYDQLAIQPIRKTIGYFLKLILLFSVILAVIYGVQVYKLINIAKNKIEDIPDFEYKNGELTFEKNSPYMIENFSSLLNGVLIIPEEEHEEAKEDISKIKTYNSYLILNKSNFSISVRDNRLQYDYKTILENYDIKQFNKEDIKTFISAINEKTLSISFVFVIMVYLFLFHILYIGADIIITFIVSFITSIIARIRLRTSALINISIYSLTLSVLLYLIYSIVNILTGFTISNFRVMYVLIAAVYAAIAVLIIKADFIERQQELAKVIKIQQEVRKDIENEGENKDEEQ